jgi:uncharacterized protein (UPF0218 family)
LREELKKPQGVLIKGSFKEAMEKLRVVVDKEQPTVIISVGDAVSGNMINQGFSPDVLVVDNKIMREPVQPIEVDTDHILHASNPPGTITEEAQAIIKCALKKKGQTKVVIDGEEDLLAVVTVLFAPENAFVVYGQPHEGIVVVKVNDETRENMRRIVDSMEESSKS